MTLNNETKQLLNRVANITLLFWVIKVLSTTVGETAADYINSDIGLGLLNTTLLMGAVTAVVAFLNFMQKTYHIPSYWSLIIMMSIEGTLITDFLVDGMGVSLITLDIVFTAAMIVIFILWYKKEGTLSIHTINNNTREIYYWIIVLVAFSVGTAYGDSISEYLNVGYFNSLIIFGAIFLTAGILFYMKLLPAVWAFWIAFIVTRPVGASLGDLLIQSNTDGGLGISMTAVNIVFFSVILLSIVSLLKQKEIEIEDFNYRR